MACPRLYHAHSLGKVTKKAEKAHLPIIMKRPWGRVEHFPPKQAVAVNAESPVAARQVHVAGSLR